MTDLGDLISQAPLGEQPATVPFPMYAAVLAELNTARDQLDLWNKAAEICERALDTVSRKLTDAEAEIARLRAGQETR